MSYIASTFPIAVSNATQFGGYTRPEPKLKRPPSVASGGTSRVVQGTFVPANKTSAVAVKTKTFRPSANCSAGVASLKAGLADAGKSGNCRSASFESCQSTRDDSCQFSNQAQMMFMLGALMAMMSGFGAGFLQEMLCAGGLPQTSNGCPRPDIGGPPSYACPSEPTFGCGNEKGRPFANANAGFSSFWG